jgi:hypothetical protein
LHWSPRWSARCRVRATASHKPLLSAPVLDW